FFNPDPIQHNLGLSRSYPDEQRFFFDHMQPSRDGWGIAFCCGTSSMIRFKALQEIGGFPTSSITEDFLLTLVLKTSGWRTVYLSEPLTEGLAPEGLKEYITQRARWCLGQMQIGRGEMGPFARNKLTLVDRWGVADACLYWLASFVFRIAVLIFPLLYWYGNITVVNAALPDAIDYFGCYYLWVLFTLNHLSRGMMVPILHDVSQLLGAIPIARNAIIGIIRPTGHKFTVTAKGGDRSKVVVQWQLMRPFLILFGLTLGGLLIGIVSPRFLFNDAGDGKWVVLYWTIYNLAVLAVTLIACIELPRQEEHVGDEPERAIAALDGRARRVWLTGLTQDRATIRGHIYEVEDRGAIRIRDVGDVDCYVIAKTVDGARIHLLPTPEQREELFLKFYADGETASISRVRGFAIMSDLLERFGRDAERN
ncbi:Curdlan synthase, partial [Thioclava sp. BHET1]